MRIFATIALVLCGLTGQAYAINYAQMTSPSNGSRLSSTNPTFTTTPATYYPAYMWVGTTGAGSSNLYGNSGTMGPSIAIQGTTTTTYPGTFPTSSQCGGCTFYIRLLSIDGQGHWITYDYTLLPMLPATVTAPVLHRNGSNSYTFTATSSAGGIDAAFYIGFSNTATQVGVCAMSIGSQSGNTISANFYSDSGAAFTPMTQVGAQASNSQCTVTLTEFHLSGNTSSVTITAVFQPTYMYSTVWGYTYSLTVPYPNSGIANIGALPAGQTPVYTPVPEVPNPTASDDSTGYTVTLPTVDKAPQTLIFSTSEGNNFYGASVYPSDTWTTTIINGPPSAGVYVSVSPSDGGQPGDVNWCGVAYLFNEFPWGTCTLGPIGYTDTTGYYSRSGNFNGMRATGWVEQWSIPTSVGDFIYNEYEVATQGGPMPTAIKGRKLGTGLRKKFIPRGDRIKAFASAKHTAIGKLHKYEITVDTSEAEIIRVGDDLDYLPANVERTAEDGWYFTGTGLVLMDENNAKRGMKTFSIESEWLPGPVSVMAQGHMDTMQTSGDSYEDMAMTQEASIERNSARRTIIGPAIPPGISMLQLRNRIRMWVAYQNLGFLQPMTKEGAVLADVLPTLEPQTEMEKQIVECLKAVVVKEEN